MQIYPFSAHQNGCVFFCLRKLKEEYVQVMSEEIVKREPMNVLSHVEQNRMKSLCYLSLPS